MNICLTITSVIFLSDFIHGQSNDTTMCGTAKRFDGQAQIYIIKEEIYVRTSMINTNQFQSIVYDARTGMIAVSGGYFRGIGTLMFLGEPYNTLIDTGDLYYSPLSSNISGLAFASNFNLLYWVDATFQYIGAIDFMKNYWIKLVYSDLDKPYSIAVNEKKRFLFWSDIGSNAKIERSNLYGAERTVIVSLSVSRPINILVDKTAQRLFWMDDNLKSSDFDGNNVVTFDVPVILKNILVSFAIHKDIVFFGTTRSQILYFNISQNNFITYISNYSFRFGTDLISQSLDSKEFTLNVENPCDKVIIKCRHFCFPQDETHHTCKCQFGFTLDVDGKSCNPSTMTKGHLFVGDRNMFYQVHRQTGETKAVYALWNFESNMAFGHYVYRNLIYFVSRNKRVIMYDASDNANYIRYVSFVNLTSLAASQTSDELYVSDSNGTITFVNDTYFSKIAYFKSADIRKIYLHSESRRLFFSDCTNNTIVELDLINNRERSKIYAGICISLMAFDFESGFAYFGNGNGSIFKYVIATRQLSHFITRPSLISAMTLDRENVYFIENAKYLTKVNKETLEAIDLTGPVFTNATEVQVVTHTLDSTIDVPSTTTNPVTSRNSLTIPKTIDHGTDNQTTITRKTTSQAKDGPSFANQTTTNNAKSGTTGTTVFMEMLLSTLILALKF